MTNRLSLAILVFSQLLLITVCVGQIPTDSLVAHFSFNGNANDESGNAHHATTINAGQGLDRFGNPNFCYTFNGVNQYIEVPDADQLSIATTGKFSVSAWLRPDTLNFENYEGDGYVHWMGKGVSSQHEYLFRMYNFDSPRPNRTSCYVFNLTGGLGSGSYVQETVVKGAWMHLVAVYDYPTNLVKIYKNGVHRDTDYFTDYSVVPGNGTAPLRIGTRDFSSYLKGAVDDIRIYSGILTQAEITALYNEPNPLTLSIFDNSNNDVRTGEDPSPIKVYPNPAQDFVMIDCSEIESPNMSITMYNAMGVPVYTSSITEAKHKIMRTDEVLHGFANIRIVDKNSGVVLMKKVLW